MVTTRSMTNEISDNVTEPNKEISDSESSSESDFLEEEFEIDEKIMDDPKLAKKVNRLVDYILERTPTLKKILETPMRIKNKSKIFELMMIYEQTLPMTEERMLLRNQLYKLFIIYKKEYKYFKEKKQMFRELENDSKSFSEYSLLQKSIMELNTSIENKKILYRKFIELRENPEPDMKLKTWIKDALKLPFDSIKVFPNETNEIKKVINHLRDYMDEHLYGMEKVKEQILLFLHNKIVNPSVKGSCMGLIGSPGVGKTTIAKCIAHALDFPLEQISFGGVNNPDFIKGHDYTYVGSKPGEIVRCLSRMKYKNGILFFDEYEKISKNQEIVACLLHVTDFSQNSEFRDNYFSDIPIDLSNIWFIYSMNELPEDNALKDRIFPIFIDGYTIKDKVNIIINYLLPKHLKNLNMKEDDVTISEDVALYLVMKTSQNNKGVREIEQLLKDTISKISFLSIHDFSTSFSVKNKLVLPLQLTKEMIDVFTKNMLKLNDSIYNLYI